MVNKILLFFCIGCHLSVCAQKLQIPDTIKTDTVWIDTIDIKHDLIIGNQAALTINPGTIVLFWGYYKIIVNGRILAIGNNSKYIYFTAKDTTDFSDTTCNAGSWHGIRFVNNTSSDSSKLSFCWIQYGKAIGDSLPDNEGGAIYVDNFSKLEISNCVIKHNAAKIRGGGICLENGSSPLIKKNWISENFLFSQYCNGGGIYIGWYCSPIISDNFIYYNSSWKKIITGGYTILSGIGGGICVVKHYLDTSSTAILRNFICNNKSENGGGIYESCLNLNIIGNIICNNYGAGILNGHGLGESKIINNTICNNINYGIDCWSSKITIMNNIIWNNPSDQYEKQLKLNANAHPIVEYNDIENGYTGIGNIDEVPLFISPIVVPGLTTMLCLTVGN